MPYPNCSRLAKLTLLTSLLSSSVITTAETFYKWKDNTGVWVYGAHPPVGVEAIEVKTNANRSRQEIEENKESVISKANTLGVSEEKRQAYCIHAQENLDALSSDAVIRVRDEEGNLVELTAESRAKEIEKAKLAKEKFCQQAPPPAE